MASNREWYENILKNGIRRPNGMDDLSENNPLDWGRVRVFRDGKLVPIMGEIHMGAPSEAQLELLKDAAEKGDLFFYPLGEAYPKQLLGDTWRSTDPAVREEKQPELQLPKPPQAPPPFTATLEEELIQAGLDPKIDEAAIADMEQREKYATARVALQRKEARHIRAQQEYQQELQQYEIQRAQLAQEHQAKVRDWQARIGFYNDLDMSIKQAVNSEAPQRRIEILRNQEVQRAAAIDSQPNPQLTDWYHNEFRRSMVRFSGAVDLAENDSMDWSRVRIWDGEKFARALPEGHQGIPDAESLKNLRDAAENGNLFMYQRGDKYPSKWTGRNWSSMDKDWIYSLRPDAVQPLDDKPVNEAGEEPKLEDFTKNISSARLAINRAFAKIGIDVYKSEAEAYDNAVARFQEAKTQYDIATEEYNRKMEVYNDKMASLQDDYNKRWGAYEFMRQNYEALTEKQRTAMEADVAERADEIKRNKEAENRKAEDLLVNEQNARDQLDGADKRMSMVGNRPQAADFLNPVGFGQQPLGQNAYDMIAPRGYDLPANSRVTPQEASAIHIALAGSAQAAMNGGLSPLSANQYGQMLNGVLYGRPSETDWKYIAGSYDAAKGYIADYENGNPQPLADALSAGLRNLVAVGRGQLDMTPEMAGLAKLTGRILDVMDAHPQLLENCTLNKEEMTFARGMVELGSIYDKALAAKMALTRQSVGAAQLTGEQLGKNTANLFVGHATNNLFKNGGQEKTQMVNTLGTGSVNKMGVVQTAIQNHPEIKAFANDPMTLKEGDLDKRMQDMARLFGNTTLAKPKESAQLREQVRNQVREQIQQNTPEAREARNRAQQLDALERQQARYVLAQQDRRHEYTSLQDPVVTQKLNELREAREALEARENQQYEKLSFRKKDLANDALPQENVNPEANQNRQPNDRVVVDTAVREKVAAMKDSLKGYADLEENKDRKPDDLIEVDGSVSNRRYELTDEAVLKEAADRASVRALMQEENAIRQKDGKRELPINEFNLGRRLNELRTAQKQLAEGEKVPDLTSDEVIGKAMENRTAREARLKGPIKELLQAQTVYAKERGLEVPADGRWPTVKIQGNDLEQAVAGGRKAMQPKGALDPFYRSEEVQNRLASLQKARKELGDAGKDLPLTDNAVIMKDYEMNGIDPVNFGIQDPSTFTAEQRKEYEERLQVIDHLRTAEGEDVNPVTSRNDYRVVKELNYRRSLRDSYERMDGVTEADKGLPLNDPRFYAMQLLQGVCRVLDKQQWCGAGEFAKLAPRIQGMDRDQAWEVAKDFFQHPEAQMQQQQPQVQDQQPQIPEQPQLQGPQAGGPM